MAAKKKQTKKTSSKKNTVKKTSSKKEIEMKKEEGYRFNHANLYYILMTISTILAIFFLVQGIIYHVEYEVANAILFYTMTALLGIVGISSHKRGKGHYHYHKNI